MGLNTPCVAHTPRTQHVDAKDRRRVPLSSSTGTQKACGSAQRLHFLGPVSEEEGRLLFAPAGAGKQIPGCGWARAGCAHGGAGGMEIVRQLCAHLDQARAVASG